MEGEKKLTIDRIILYEEPIKERHNLDAYLLFKRKKVVERRNYRAMVYVCEKLDNRTPYFCIQFNPGFFDLLPGDKVSRERLTRLENQHREKVKRWVDTNNSRFIITENQCDCNTDEPKIHAFSMKNTNKEDFL